MAKILITEFMDEAARLRLGQAHSVHYDPELFSAPDRLLGMVAETDALIVRNRTQVSAQLLAAGR